MTGVYHASPIKRRRASNAEMEQRAEFLIAYANEHGPVTVRGLFYQAVTHGMAGIEKDETGYAKVQHQVLQLRRDGRLPYNTIADASRYGPRTAPSRHSTSPVPSAERPQRRAGRAIPTGSAPQKRSRRSSPSHARIAHGSGGNGKGVFIGAVAGALGDYHKTAPIETFAASSGDRHPTELAMLRGARLVTAQETEEGRRWAESKVKMLTGGDRIAARFMRADFFEFTPQFTLLIAGNHKPGLRSVDEAIRRRFHLIPFTITIGPEERDEELPEKLKAEWAGILQWAIDGCLEWQRRGGLNPPEVVRTATDAYLDGQDAIGAWLDENCVTDPNAWTPRTALYANWQGWAERAREFVMPRPRFFDALEGRGYSEKRANDGTRGFQGISLRQIDYSEAHWNS